jgi:hypothetical protein
LTIVSKISQASHIYYVSCWLLNHNPIWQIGENLEVLFMGQGGLGSIDVTSQGKVFEGQVDG